MANGNEFEQVLNETKRLERILFRFVLTSFVFSFLAVLAQYDKFDKPFQALTELIGGTMGAAGILSAYLSHLRHPEDEVDRILTARPTLPGLRITVMFAFTSAAFYLFYYCASQSRQVSLVFLSAGLFCFFRELGHATLAIRDAERQRLVWQKLSPEDKAGLRKQQREEQEAFRETRKLLEDGGRMVRESQLNRKRLKRERLRTRLRWFFGGIWSRTLPLRKKIRWDRLLSIRDKLNDINAERVLQEIMLEGIKKGEALAMTKEGSDRKYFSYGTSIYTFLEGEITSNDVTKIIEDLLPLRTSPRNPTTKVVAVLRPSKGSITVDAHRLFMGAGIDIYAQPERVPSAQSSNDHKE